MDLTAPAALAALIWLIILVLPWRPWWTRETLDAGPPAPAEDLGNITALIPARNEADVIGATLSGLQSQGSDCSGIQGQGGE